MALQTPKSGHLSEINFESTFLFTSEIDTMQSLVQLLKLEEERFRNLDLHEQGSTITTLYRALKIGSYSLADLEEVEDAIDILHFVLSSDFQNVALLAKHKDVFEKILAQIPKCTLTRDQKIELAVAILIREGTSGLDSRMALDFSERKEVLQRYEAELNKTFPNVILSQDFEKLKALAHAFFSGPRKVPGSQHHMVLVGLLYARDPDLEAITFVMQKYLIEQRTHFSKHGIFLLNQSADAPKLSSYHTLAQIRYNDRSVMAFHPGGAQSINAFLKRKISGAQIDDESPGLLVYLFTSVADPKMVETAQVTAAQNMDFPAFLELDIKPDQVGYDECMREYRIYPDSEFNSFKIKPMQPHIRSPSMEAIQRLYSDRSDLVKRIFDSIQNPVTIQNPKDRVRRVLFQDDDSSSSNEDVDLIRSPPKHQNDKNFLLFIFKCLIGLFAIKLCIQLFFYLHSKFRDHL